LCSVPRGEAPGNPGQVKKMSEDGTGNKATDGDLLPDLNLKNAADSIAAASARLEMRQSIGKDLRGAIKHILEAQEKLEGHSTVAELRLDLLEAIRLIGVAESVLKSSQTEAGSERPTRTVSQRVSAPEKRSRLGSSLPDPRTEVDPGPDSSARRGLPLPSDPVPSRVTVPEAGPVHAEGGAVDPLNRRSFDRLAVTYPIQLQPPYNGFSNSDLTQLSISGITLNLSRGGMLAQIEQGILRHGRYLIRFLGAGQSLRPEIMWGRVRRSRAADSGWEVGIEFDTPLEILRP